MSSSRWIVYVAVRPLPTREAVVIQGLCASLGQRLDDLHLGCRCPCVEGDLPLDAVQIVVQGR